LLAVICVKSETAELSAYDASGAVKDFDR